MTRPEEGLADRVRNHTPTVERQMSWADEVEALKAERDGFEMASSKAEAELAEAKAARLPQPTRMMVEAASDAIFEMTRGALISGVVDGLPVRHIGTSRLAEAVLRAAFAGHVVLRPDEIARLIEWAEVLKMDDLPDFDSFDRAILAKLCDSSPSVSEDG